MPEKLLRGGGFVPSRTQIVCLHEGKKGRSIDPVFIGSLLKALAPVWVRRTGNNFIRTVDGGGRKELIAKMPAELRSCADQGGKTTLMVWADLDDNMVSGDQLREEFWKVAKEQQITREEFETVVFVFAKDRLENWIQFLNTGNTDESLEGPRIKHDAQVAAAARTLASRCKSGAGGSQFPPSLTWSCANWRRLVERMKD